MQNNARLSNVRFKMLRRATNLCSIQMLTVFFFLCVVRSAAQIEQIDTTSLIVQTTIIEQIHNDVNIDNNTANNDCRDSSNDSGSSRIGGSSGGARGRLAATPPTRYAASTCPAQ
jgi:hypothetical protein